MNDTRGGFVATINGPMQCASNGKTPHPTDSSPIDVARIRAAVREILEAIGEDPERDGLQDTPSRVAKMYAEVFSGLHTDPRIHLKKTFEVDHEELVLQRDIEFSTFCEHHFLPFSGKAHIAYLPTGRVVGLSKLARVVEGIARRPQVQERMTQQIADLIEEELAPRGVLVVIDAVHSCMTIRGVKKPGTSCVTTSARGLYQTNLTARAEVLSLINGLR